VKLACAIAYPFAFLTLGFIFIYISPNHGAPMEMPSFESGTSCTDTTIGSTPSE